MDSVEIDSGWVIQIRGFREQNRIKESVLLLPYFLLKNSDGYIPAILEFSRYFACDYILAEKNARIFNPRRIRMKDPTWKRRGA